MTNTGTPNDSERQRPRTAKVTARRRSRLPHAVTSFLMPLEERFGFLAGLERFLTRRVSLERSILFAVGAVVLLLFVTQAITGLLLSLYYSPSPEMAYDSIQYIVGEVSFGWLIRSIHKWAGTIMILLVVVHLLVMFLRRAYRKPAEVDWLISFLFLLLLLLFQFSGNLLPWDQKAYWTAVEELKLLRDVPAVGPLLVELLQGGEKLSAATLSRFYSTHLLLLPWVSFYLVVFYFLAGWALRGHRRGRS